MKKTDKLKWFDILILTFILWGAAIQESTQCYLELIKGSSTIEEMTTFTALDNYTMLLKQIVLFLIAIFYLIIRKFNFKTWNIHLSLKAIIYGVLLFIGSGLVFDIYSFITNPIVENLPFPGRISIFFLNQNVSDVIYAIFNGIYEEIYFLGICLAVSPKQLKWSILFSLIIRVSFHTYQGIIVAIGIGIVYGIYMLWFYYKSQDKNLFPFFIAHALADIFGLTILWIFGI
ncbi:CPBP family glutamic-type intramembrane protease [Caviibacter abscessus]|uniref:CPBP family glutamic-type intramembrane protease n=1 Tax=Caviibacter abscessus TaxID=1766719 RepID=UPI000B1CD5BA|nr:CPBP family glutamic-type intramembrane protease [Caviibacter abscessus]